jgi:hypothetical protein
MYFKFMFSPPYVGIGFRADGCHSGGALKKGGRWGEPMKYSGPEEMNQKNH